MRRPTFVKQRSRLDKRVYFERKSNARDAFNEEGAPNWQPLFDTKCAIYPAGGYEKFSAGQNAATHPIVCEVRYEDRAKTLLPSDRLKVDGVTYSIVAPIEQMERGRNVRIVAAADVK